MGVAIENTPSLFAHLWRYKWYIVGAAILAAAVSYGLSTLQDPVYRAEGTVLLNDPRSSGGIADEIGLVLDPRRYVRNQAKIIESPQVAERAANNLGGGTSSTEVQGGTVAIPATDLDAITVTGTAGAALDAVALVDALVEAYEEIVTEQIQASVNGSIATLQASKTEVTARVSELDTQIAERPDESALEAERTAAVNQLVALNTRIELLATNAALYGSGVQLYVIPNTPGSPISPQPKRSAAIAFVVGAVLAGSWAWWRGQANRFADDRNTPALVLDAPLLATIPVFKESGAAGPIPTVTSPESEATEAYQFALSSIGFALEGISGKTVLITSTSPGDGKTATAINLAIAAAQDGRQLLLLDADVRARGLTRLSGLLSVPGISDFDGPESVSLATHQWQMEDGTHLDFVPAGNGIGGNTATFFRSRGFRTALSTLLEKREMVIIDSPPVMAAAETTDIGTAVHGIVLVVQQGTPIRDLRDAKARLSMIQTPIIGYIFNRATSAVGANGYGYGT